MGIGSELDVDFTPPDDFHAGYKYDLAHVSLETYRSFASIDSSNNVDYHSYRVL